MKDVKQKHFSFNGESSVIEVFRNLVSLLFVFFFSWLPFGRRKQDELRLKPFFTTNTDNSLFFRTFSFHSRSQTREKMQ